jgi:tetratricopeptide (TPR) repeat protein
MKVPARTVFLAFLGALFLVSTGVSDHASAQEGAGTIVIQRPRVHPDTRSNRDTVEAALLQAATHLTRTNARVVVVAEWAPGTGSAAPARGTYRLTVDAIRDPATPTIALTLAGTGTATGRQASAIPLQDGWDGDLYRALAQQIFYVWAQAQGFQSLATADPPVFVDELPLSELVGSTVSVGGATLYPYSAASMPDGGVVIGAIGTAVHLGGDFRVLGLPGLTLLEQGDFSSAMTVSATPAGTIITRPSLGNTLYRYPPGSTEPERIRNPLTGQGPMTILPDGSVVITDLAGRRAARLDGRRRDPLEIFTLDYSFVPAVATGPEGNLWTYDTSRRMILIYSPEGTLLDSILPAIPIEQAGGVRAMAIGPTGDAVLLTTGELWRIDRSGTPVWSTDSIDGGLAGGFAPVMGIAWDAPTGTIWLTDYMGQRVVRMQEVELRLDGVMDPLVREVLALNRQIEGAPAGEPRATLLTEKARRYAEAGALEMAQSVLRRALDEDPFSSDAIEEIDRLEVALLRREAVRLDAVVRRRLEEFGRETARDDYRRTIRLYEQILNISPAASDIRDARTALEERFEQREGTPRRDDELQLALEVERLFPVLLDQYRRGGAGSITVTNDGSQAIENLSVTVEIPGFTDGPGTVPVDPDLPPGVRTSVDLPVLLNSRVLELQEDIAVAVVVEASFRAGGGSYRTTRRGETTIHRRTALVWDDSAKLAAFVTPNEDVVAGFALRTLAALSDDDGSAGGGAGVTGSGASSAGRVAALSPRLLRAISLADALGSYGIAYVEDPRSPFSEVQGTLTAVDTVRFPRTTLYYRSGDCDDTSALLASLYEAAGLDTAVVTTPGHVMIAVDTREPLANRWMYETGSTTILEHGGTIWIPVETTVLSDGFATAWREGSALVRRHLPEGAVEILPVREIRDRFPPLPLPPSSFSITEPPAGVVASRVAETAAYTASLLYENGRATLENELAMRAGSRRIPVLNRLGILHGRFGEADRARRALEEAIELRSDYLPAFINLANIELLEGDPERALSWLDEAELLAQEDPMVMEMLARAHFAADSGREARRYVRALAERAPERAAGLALILPPSGRAALPDGGRASAVPSSGGPGSSGDAGDAGRAAAFRAAALPPVEWPAGE